MASASVPQKNAFQHCIPDYETALSKLAQASALAQILGVATAYGPSENLPLEAVTDCIMQLLAETRAVLFPLSG